MLECNIQVWSPFVKKDINKIESVQRNFTRLICNRCNISDSSYNERLVKLGLRSLEYRRWEFDLFMLYEIINGKYKAFFSQFFSFSHNKNQLRGKTKKKKVKIVLTTVSGRIIFSKSRDYVEQITIGCSIV